MFISRAAGGEGEVIERLRVGSTGPGDMKRFLPGELDYTVGKASLYSASHDPV